MDCLVCSCMFFFSSRRRHTRLTCDWSSDVCSSDLIRRIADLRGHFLERPPVLADATGRGGQRHPTWQTMSRSSERSEERRVGKECRSRWSPDHYKKKMRYSSDVG